MGQTLLEGEDALEEALDWEAGLQELHARIVHRFSRSEYRQRVLAYLQGLLGSVERKNAGSWPNTLGTPRPICLSSTTWDCTGSPPSSRRICTNSSSTATGHPASSSPATGPSKPESTDATRGRWSDGGCGVREYAGEDLMRMEWTMRGVCPTPGGC